MTLKPLGVNGNLGDAFLSSSSSSSSSSFNNTQIEKTSTNLENYNQTQKTIDWKVQMYRKIHSTKKVKTLQNPEVTTLTKSSWKSFEKGGGGTKVNNEFNPFSPAR